MSENDRNSSGAPVEPDISMGRQRAPSSEPGRASSPRDARAPRPSAGPTRSSSSADADDEMLSLSYSSSRARRMDEQERAPPPPPPPPPRPVVEVRRSGQRQAEPKSTQEAHSRHTSQEEPRSYTATPQPPRRSAEPRATPPPPVGEYRHPRPAHAARPHSPAPQAATFSDEFAEPPVAPGAVSVSASSSREFDSLLSSRRDGSEVSYKEWGIALLMMLATAMVGLIVANIT